MVTIETVNNDAQTLQGLFSNYGTQMDALNNDSLWQGASKDNAINNSSEFISEYKQTIANQLASFANALSLYENYKSAKTNRDTFNSYAYNTQNQEEKNYYLSQANEYSGVMNNLTSQINNLLTTIASQKLESAVSTVANYKNYVTINDFVNYFQGDYANYAYGATGTIASSGCGPTSMAMVLTYLTGEQITPVETAAYSLQHGYRIQGSGTTAALFPAMAKEYGLNCVAQSPTPQNIIQSLSEGKIIIAHMGKGTFTNGGHYIVLKGLDANGRVIVADPASRTRTGQSYDASLISRESIASMYSFTV